MLRAVSRFDGFQFHFPHVKKHWQGQRNSDQEHCQHSKPSPANSKPRALDSHEHDQNDGGSQNINSEKGADPVREQFAD
jgi:hypothetical protein